MAEASLGLLQAMVQRVLDGQAGLRDDMIDVKERLVSLERATVASRRDQANDAEHVAHVRRDGPPGGQAREGSSGASTWWSSRPPAMTG